VTSERAAWIALSSADHIGMRTLRALAAQFGSLRAALLADTAALLAVPGVGPATVRSIRAVDLAAVERRTAAWRSAGVRILTQMPDDSAYPACLRLLDDAPPTLFTRSAWETLTCDGVAVVGTRAPSAQGRAAARLLGFELARRGLAVVSGLARGVDTEAHLGAVSAPGGRTLAVLGGGVQRVYPAENTALAQLIVRSGALISENPPDAAPSGPRLVARNRLISGLSRAVIVVETAADGGAMHTARFARDQGRPVYALDIAASGNRALLDSGALPLALDLQDLDFEAP
jgi:DNA processing protein